MKTGQFVDLELTKVSCFPVNVNEMDHEWHLAIEGGGVICGKDRRQRRIAVNSSYLPAGEPVCDRCFSAALSSTKKEKK